ncbi:MAG: ribonuclease III [Candidatus Berkiellales bacterium]
MKLTDKLHYLEQKLGYHFQDKALLVQALTHKSAGAMHNERLEFLGDAVLNFVVADLLYQQFPKAKEGDLTRARASLVNKTALFEIAQTFSIGEYLQLGLGEQRSGGFRRESILADALEAIIGAIYLEGNFKSTYQCIHDWFSPRIATLNPENHAKDPKTELQEWLQANQKSLPQYQVIAIEGEPHAQIFTIRCEIPDLSIMVQGTGTSRRISEQIAARKVLELLHDSR